MCDQLNLPLNRDPNGGLESDRMIGMCSFVPAELPDNQIGYPFHLKHTLTELHVLPCRLASTHVDRELLFFHPLLSLTHPPTLPTSHSHPHTLTCIHTCTHHPLKHSHTHSHTHLHTLTHTYTHTRAHTLTHTHTLVHTYTHMYTHFTNVAFYNI